MAKRRRTSNVPRPSSRDLIGRLRAQGMSVKDIAAECDRDPSLIYQVANGKRKGDNLRTTLDQLNRGKVTTRPPRRKTKAGTPAHVRGPAGTAVTPPPPTPTKPRRGKYGETAVYLTGGTQRQITAPKSERSKGRAKAKEQTKLRLAEAARDKKRVAFTVHLADGTARAIGDQSGYNGSDVWRVMAADPTFKDDPFEWLGAELARVDAVRYGASDQGAESPIVGVDMTVFGTDHTPTIPRGVRGYINEVGKTRRAEARAATQARTGTKRTSRKKKKPAPKGTGQQLPLF